MKNLRHKLMEVLSGMTVEVNLFHPILNKKESHRIFNTIYAL